jgi:plastocyanin
MSNTLDSRALRRTDCYAQRFVRAGRYRYDVVPAFGHLVSSERPFTITVAEAGSNAKMKQHNLIVRSDAGRFTVDQKELAIAAGDLVLWNSLESRGLSCTVVGDKEFFASHRLTNECGYSHAFGSPGEYRWADAYGSGASGLIRVRDPMCKDEAAFKRWRGMLATGTLVTVNDAVAHPREIEIFTGQTVFFAVVRGPGISITDERLLASSTDGKYQPPKEAPRARGERPSPKRSTAVKPRS